MWKFVLVLVLALMMAGCASKEKRYAASRRPDAEKVQTCITLADMYTRTGSGFSMMSKGSDKESALRLCQAVAKQIPGDFNSPYWAGRLMQSMGDGEGACQAYSEATKRGHPGHPFTLYCNEDGTPK